MKLYDVSQLPVMDGDEHRRHRRRVRRAAARLRRRSALPRPGVDRDGQQARRLDVTAPIESLLPVFDRGHVAIVIDGDKFLGLITRIDLLNYLRRRVQ